MEPLEHAETPIGAPAWLRLGAGAATLGTGAWVGLGAWMRWRGRRRVAWTVAALPPGAARPWAIVPGCLAHPDGRPSRPLAQRLQAAWALWEAGLAQRLLVSGVGRETVAMARWLQAEGVPRGRITQDPGGARTHLTMQRARELLGVQGAFVCTQAYHLPRALWLAETCGIDALGLAADGPRAGRAPRALRHRVYDTVREAAARGAAVADVWAERRRGAWPPDAQGAPCARRSPP